MDLLGHGKSDGTPGDMDFDDCLSSINEVIEKIKGTTRIFILAHSIVVRLHFGTLIIIRDS